MPIIDLAGQRFGRLVVVSVAGRRHNQALWQCKCDCGNEAQVVGQVLRRGGSQSCGCLRTETRGRATTTHGMSKAKEYLVWQAMRNRCNRPSSRSYSFNGGRGIRVCPRWDNPHGFEAFMQDMGPRPEGGTIERIDNDGNYEPSNCRWATRLKQSKNKRSPHFLTANGVTEHLAEWARDLGCSEGAITKRIETGMPVERALTEPIPKRPNAKLTAEAAAQIRGLYPAKTMAQLAAMFDVGRTSIANVLHGKTFADVESEPVDLDWKSSNDRSRLRATSRVIVANGEAKPLANWARILGVSPNTIHARLKYGWTEQDAVTVFRRPHANSKLTAGDAAKIRASHPAMSQRKLAALYGVHKESIRNVLKGKTFRQ